MHALFDLCTLSGRRWILGAALAGSAVFGCGLGEFNYRELRTIERRLQPAGLPSNPLARRGHQPEDLLAQSARGNQYVEDWKAARLGQMLFFSEEFTAVTETDPELRRTSCASCHDPNKNFSDGLARSVGARPKKQLARRSPSIRTAAHRSFLFWDGRADSLWAQALGPFEDMLEIHSNRGRVASTIATNERLREAYEAAFGAGSLPPWLKAGVIDAMPRPLGDAEVGQEVEKNLAAPGVAGVADGVEKGPKLAAQAALSIPPAAGEHKEQPPPEWFTAWKGLGEAKQKEVDLIFVRVGKAIEAYEQRLAARGSRFDVAMTAIAAGKKTWLYEVTTPEERLGLKLFVGKAGCVSCHQGPDLTDEQFHYLGLPETADVKLEDTMWMKGAVTLYASKYRCDGEYADGCGRAARRRLTGRLSVETLATKSIPQRFVRGRVRTPSLRDTASNSHWMHGGHFESLDEVLDFYDDPGESPEVTRGQRRASKETSRQRERRGNAPFPARANDGDLVPFRKRDFRMGWLASKRVKLSTTEKSALKAFLASLTSAPVDPSLLNPDAGGFGRTAPPTPAPATTTPPTPAPATTTPPTPAPVTTAPPP